MQTLRKAISDVINDLKSYDLDDKFSFRFLAHKLRGKIEIFIKQDADLRAIFNINEIWKPLPCIKLKDADYDHCSEFYDYCELLKKSTKKLPSVYTSRYGNTIKILNVNNSIEYVQIKSFQYKDIKQREYRNRKIKYFWIEDGYLYIPDADIEEVRGICLPKDSQEVDFFNNHCDDCYKPLDSILLVPDYILDLAKTEVSNELVNKSKRMIVDERPNLNSNEKTNP